MKGCCASCDHVKGTVGKESSHRLYDSTFKVGNYHEHRSLKSVGGQRKHVCYGIHHDAVFDRSKNLKLGRFAKFRNDFIDV